MVQKDCRSVDSIFSRRVLDHGQVLQPFHWNSSNGTPTADWFQGSLLCGPGQLCKRRVRCKEERRRTNGKSSGTQILCVPMVPRNSAPRIFSAIFTWLKWENSWGNIRFWNPWVFHIFSWLTVIDLQRFWGLELRWSVLLTWEAYFQGELGRFWKYS